MVLKPRVSLDQDVAIVMIKPITAWLGLHYLKTQAKFWVTLSLLTILNVYTCPLENAIEIVLSIDACYIDILIEATSIMDTQIFYKKYLQMTTDYMAMYDYHKKGEGAPQKTIGTNKNCPNDVQKILLLSIDRYEGDLFRAELLLKDINFTFEMQKVGVCLENEQLC